LHWLLGEQQFGLAAQIPLLQEFLTFFQNERSRLQIAKVKRWYSLRCRKHNLVGELLGFQRSLQLIDDDLHKAPWLRNPRSNPLRSCNYAQIVRRKPVAPQHSARDQRHQCPTPVGQQLPPGLYARYNWVLVQTREQRPRHRTMITWGEGCAAGVGVAVRLGTDCSSIRRASVSIRALRIIC
jgi:hypothetical protein